MSATSISAACAHSFPGAPGFLNTSTVGLPPTGAVSEIHAAITSWQAGTASAPGYDVSVQRSREAFARLVGVPPSWVAAAGQVSSFTGLIAASLPAGAEVVGYENEFSSVIFPFLARADLRVRLVPLDQVAGAVGSGTALVAISSVQSSDGAVADLEAVTAAARAAGARLLVDATQAVGWLPTDAAQADYLVCGAYKWLLSPRGTAFLSVRPEHWEALRPVNPSWYAAEDPWDALYGGPLRLAPDARRFNLSPAWLCWVGTAPALELIESIGVEAIHAHDVALATRVRDELGLEPSVSACVSLAITEVQRARLEEAGVRYAVRDGRARLAFHLYNTGADVETVLSALSK